MGGPSPSRRRARGRWARPWGSPRECSSTSHHKAAEKVVRGEVLKRLEARAEGTHVAGVWVKGGDCLAQPEITRRPRVRAGQMACEEPVGGPFAEPADGGQTLFDLLVRKFREAVVVEPRR